MTRRKFHFAKVPDISLADFLELGKKTLVINRKEWKKTLNTGLCMYLMKHFSRWEVGISFRVQEQGIYFNLDLSKCFFHHCCRSQTFRCLANVYES